jgi:hypothetical protein
MALSHSHSHSAQLALLAQEDSSNAGMELAYLISLHALLLLTPTMALSDAQMVLSDQAFKTAQPEESAHHLLQSTVMMETAKPQAPNALLTLALRD